MLRLAINLGLLSVLALGSFLVYHNTISGVFSGELLLPLEGETNIAIARSGENDLTHPPPGYTIYAGKSLAELEGVLPSQAYAMLDPNQAYDAIVLPFSLQLDSTSFVEPSIARHTLTVEDGSDTSEIEVDEGDSISVGGDSYSVAHLRTWAGLYPAVQGGQPMAECALAVGQSPWIEHIFIPQGEWETFEPEGAAQLIWVSDEGEARARGDMSQLEGGMRWGVVEGDRTHWFKGAQAGTGVTLDDGTAVMLLALEEGDGETSVPAIKVSVEGKDGTVLYRIEANTASPGGLVQFDYPAARRYRLAFFAWQDNRALVTGILDGHPLAPVVVNRGDVITEPESKVRLRFDGCYGQALAIREIESTVSEAVLKGESTELRLRHGERVRVGNGAITYRRQATAALANLRIIMHHAATGQVTTRLLHPNEVFRDLTWQITQKPLTVAGADAFVIQATYDPGLRLFTWFGYGMAVVSGTLLLIRMAAFVWRRTGGLS